jgi:hypothetical protein
MRNGLGLRARWPVAAIAAAAAIVIAGGCGRRPPPMVVAEGSVTLDGRPLPKVRLEFVPTFTGFGGELLATAEAGDDARFRVMNGIGAGLCAGTYKVTVHELPPPPDMQEYRADTPARQKAYYAGLVNRPIPECYGSLATTPLAVEIVPGTTDYPVALDR